MYPGYYPIYCPMQMPPCYNQMMRGTHGDGFPPSPAYPDMPIMTPEGEIGINPDFVEDSDVREYTIMRKIEDTRNPDKPKKAGTKPAEPSPEQAPKTSFTTEEALQIGRMLGIDWNSSKFDVEQFRKGLDTELEHGRRDPETNVTGDNPILTGKIALAHLREFPDYYTRLGKLEEEAKAYWGAVGK